MTKTDNLSLPQWVESDPFQRADFNEAFASLDTGYSTAMSNSAEAAATAATAKETADAAYCPDFKPYAVGSYTGTGEEQTIELGFQPSFLIITGSASSHYGNLGYTAYHVITGGSQCDNAVAFTETGFTVTPQTQSEYCPRLTVADRVYSYIAFR